MCEIKMSAVLVLRGLSHWLADGCLLAGSPTWSSSLCISVLISSSCKGTSHVGLGLTLKTSFILLPL